MPPSIDKRQKIMNASQQTSADLITSMRKNAAVHSQYVDDIKDWQSNNGTKESSDIKSKSIEQKLLGNEFIKQQNYKKAISHYNKGLKIMPSNSIILVNRALAFLKIEDYYRAEQDCTDFINLDTRNLKAYFRRATARTKLGNIEGATADLLVARTLDPTNELVKKDLEALTSGRRNIPVRVIGNPKDYLKRNNSQGADNSDMVAVKSTRFADDGGKSFIEASSLSSTHSSAGAESTRKRSYPIGSSSIPTFSAVDPVISAVSPISINRLKRSDENDSGPKSVIPPKSMGTRIAKEIKVSAKPAEAKSTKLIVKDYAIPSTPIATSIPIQNNLNSSNRRSPLVIKLITPLTSARVPTDPPKTMIEFSQTWKALCKEKELLYQYLLIIDPSKLPTLFKSSIEEDHLDKILDIILDCYKRDGLKYQAAALCEGLSKVERIGMAAAFLMKAHRLLDIKDWIGANAFWKMYE